jgi:hypothetical protein
MGNLVTFPTRLTLRCRGCERVATIRAVLPKVKNADGFVLPPKFRCKVCHSTDVVVKQRGAAWHYRPTPQDRRRG